jgi:putative phage-type endonuclease
MTSHSINPEAAGQRSPEWFEARKGRVTGSIAGAALGLCPWMNPAQVIRKLVRDHHGAPSEFVGNPATEYGTRHERAAILRFIRATGFDVAECGFLPIGDFSGASPDGLTSDDAILEIKVPYGLRKEVNPQFKSLAEQPHYEVQVQLEMIAAGRDRAYFVQYRPQIGNFGDFDFSHEVIRIEEVELWRGKQYYDLLNDLQAFHKKVQSELDNPAHLEPLRVQVECKEAEIILNHIDELDQQIKAAKESRDDALKKLVELAGGQNAEICGRKLTKVVTQGAVSYAKAIKELCPDADLEKYRGKPTESWRIY